MRQTPRSFVAAPFKPRVFFLSFLALLPLLVSVPLRAQAPPAPDSATPKPSTEAAGPSGSSPQSPSTAEVVTRDSAATFKVRVNVVLVRVVVRDQQGKVIDNLKKEDFQLFDNRKPQTISAFSLETPGSHAVPVVTVSDRSGADAVEKAQPTAAALPQRFVSLLFDDLHLSMEDAVYDRTAATKIFDSLAPSDRVGIYTTSGQFAQEFASDHEVLKNALNQIIPRPLADSTFHDCPDLSYYQADLIQNKQDSQALGVAAEDALQCAFNGDETKIAMARSQASAAASRTVSNGDASSDYTYRHMEDVLRRLSAMPGQRKLVFISPGFILSTLMLERVDIIDRSNRAGVVIDTLDARGLYTPDLGDIASPSVDTYKTAGYKTSYRVQAQFAQEQILDDLASGTGGTFYHNRNDIDVALREAVAAPVASYLLAFSPQNLKLNGSFHTLKVALVNKQKFNVQARRGYYAPRTAKDPAQAAKEEIQEAVFSQEEIHDLLVDLQTQFFKKDQAQARLSVLAHLDLKSVKFRKVEGRNHDDLTLATVIFDENGNYVAGGEKILEMKLLDSTLDRLDRSGITVKSSFDVKPGSYLVRLVVRDKEGEMMAARNGAVVIPN